MSNIETLNNVIKALDNSDGVSDGYHTFGELYEHRIAIFIALCENLSEGNKHPVWRSQYHSDGTTFEGWFILGIGKKKGEQITYHIPIEKWAMVEFAEHLGKSPKWDGHTSEDVLDRLIKL